MSANPEYGLWAMDNADCLSKAELDMGVKTFELCWCIVCACQAFFFAIRYPQVSWEYVLVPAAQALTYGLGYSGIGYIQLADGKIICWTRPALWLVTVPTILMQINAMGSVQFFSIDTNSLQVTMSLVMIVSGVSASLSEDMAVKWMFFVVGALCLVLIFLVTNATFGQSLAKFSDAGTPNAHRVATRLKVLYGLFFPSWASYPLLYILSLEGACVAEENVIVVCFVLADVIAKNAFGIILWDTVWNILKGKWELPDEGDGKALMMEEGKSGVLSPPPQPPNGQQSLNPDDKELQVDMVLRPGAPVLPPPPAYPAYSAGVRDVEMSTASPAQAIQMQALMQRRANSPGDLGGGVGYGLDGGVDASRGWSGRGGGGAGRQRQAVDEVVDHVRNLNQALSDLLVYDSLSSAPNPASLHRFEDADPLSPSPQPLPSRHSPPGPALAPRIRAISPPRR